MKYGYARVSTTDQKLANQIELLKLAGAEKIFQEKFTGTTTERPEFQKLLRVLKTGDTLIVTKLDRFARNTREALAIIQELFKEKSQHFEYGLNWQYADWPISLYNI